MCFRVHVAGFCLVTMSVALFVGCVFGLLVVLVIVVCFVLVMVVNSVVLRFFAGVTAFVWRASCCTC